VDYKLSNHRVVKHADLRALPESLLQPDGRQDARRVVRGERGR
jgi:hypothetical protein